MSITKKSVLGNHDEFRKALVNVRQNQHDSMLVLSFMTDLILMLQDDKYHDFIDDFMSPDAWDSESDFFYFYSMSSLLICHQQVNTDGNNGAMVQVGIPVTVYIDESATEESYLMDRNLPRLFLHNVVGQTLIKELSMKGKSRVKDDSGFMLSSMLHKTEFFRKRIGDLYSLPHQLVDGQEIDAEEPLVAIDKKDMFTFMIYGVLVESDCTQFIHTRNDSKLGDPLALREWRETSSKILQAHYKSKGQDIQVRIGPPAPLINSLSIANAYVREANMWRIMEDSDQDVDYSIFTALINEDPVDGVVTIQIFDDNRCIMVFDYGYRIIHNQKSKDEGGEYLDGRLLESKLRYKGINKIFHTTKDLGGKSLEELLIMPMIG